MEDELFTVYDKDASPIGQTTRAIAHREGLWHAVIHVWLYDDEYVYIQQRSLLKKDYAGLFDITCAGHIDAGEPIDEAAIRECREEIGIELDKQQLHYVGTIKEAVFMNGFVDKEIGYVYIYKSFYPQFDIGEEVESVYKAYKNDFKAFALDKRKGLDVYIVDNHDHQHLNAAQLCQHGTPYYLWLLEQMK